MDNDASIITPNPSKYLLNYSKTPIYRAAPLQISSISVADGNLKIKSKLKFFPKFLRSLREKFTSTEKIKHGFESKFKPEISHFLSINLISNQQQTYNLLEITGL